MGVVDKVKEEFYQLICSEHVLLLCALDVDALCACKILQFMFKADDVEHTVIPVTGKADVKEAYNDHAEQVKSVVFINCGGCLNLLELLQPENQEVRFFIIDSRRPLELDNVYNQDQIILVVREGDELDVPEFDQIYSSDMEEEDDEDYFSDEDSGPRNKRRRTGKEDSYETKRKKHLWRRKREEILYKYYEFSYHETAASLVVYELACKLNRDSNDLVWLAIVGLTEQLQCEKIDRVRYLAESQKLQLNVIRHNRSDEDVPPSSINSMRITFDNELRLTLYRHWTLYESLCHSEYTVCRFKIWSMKGQKKLLEFLADMGMPLIQCKQKFLSMDVQYRDSLKQLINESSHKFQLEDMTYGSFVAQFGYKLKLCASDMVHSSMALIENPDKSCSEAFLTALEALSRTNIQLTYEGIELAKQQQISVMDQVRNFIETHQVVCAGSFVYAYIEEGTPSVKNYSKPQTLCKLARFLRESWIVINKKARDLPFILSAPLDVTEGYCLVVGVPPHSEDTRKSEFTRAFQHAADRIQAHASFDSFDGSVLEIKKDERGKFFDALSALTII